MHQWVHYRLETVTKDRTTNVHPKFAPWTTTPWIVAALVGKETQRCDVVVWGRRSSRPMVAWVAGTQQQQQAREARRDERNRRREEEEEEEEEEENWFTFLNPNKTYVLNLTFNQSRKPFLAPVQFHPRKKEQMWSTCMFSTHKNL